MRLSHCTLPGEPWHSPSSPWRAGRAADGTYRQDGVWTGVEKVRSYVPCPPSPFSSYCADLPCSNPERGCTPDFSIHKTLPRPPSFFDCLITWPSHPSTYKPAILHSSTNKKTLHHKLSTSSDANLDNRPSHRPDSSSTLVVRPYQQSKAQGLHLTATAAAMMVSPVRPSKKHYDSSSSSSSYGSFSSSDSDVSASSVRASMERPIASIEVIRCLRCARCVEMTTTDDASMYGMIRVGTGIYYCDRCARMTGYGK